MAKFTDAIVVTLKGYFNAGDQPTEAQFAALITAIQEGIEEHQHDSTGDGDGTGILNGPITMAEDTWQGIGAALERFVFNGSAGAIAVMGAAFGVGVLDPDGHLEVHSAGYTESFIDSDLDADASVFGALKFQARNDAAGDITYVALVTVILENEAANEAGELRLYIMQDGVSEKMVTIGAATSQLAIVQGIAGGTNAVPVLELKQDDISEGFINFVGSDRGVIGEGINSVESVRVEINGVVRRIAVYADA